MIRTWRLDTPAQTLAFAARGGRPPEVVHWGAPLPSDEDLAALAEALRPAAAGGMADAPGAISTLPDPRAGDPGAPLLVLDGIEPTFAFETDARDGDRLALAYVDDRHGLRWTLLAEAFRDSDVISVSARLEGAASTARRFAAPVVALPDHAVDMLVFTGRWCGEFQTDRRRIAPGVAAFEARGGRTGHEAFPGILFATPTTGENAGEAWGAHFAWSGGHRMEVERLPDGRGALRFEVVIGDAPAAADAHDGEAVLLTRSDEGLGGVSHAFHRHLRRHALRFAEPQRPRPVHYNCWEAVYFDHDREVLSDLAVRAARLGVERFVLDDGWFGRRDDDTSSLGDWTVDPRKWPDGLGPFIEEVRGLGMDFGLWVEPEMVNPDSELFRKRRDWTLGSPSGPLARNQLVLDMSRDEVSAWAFEWLDALLRDHDIAYLKWDHNRALPHPDPRQARAVHALMDRLRAAHPGVEIETCASGGGRVDFAMLARTQRFWPSDSNDALERWAIQRGASCFFPPEITGSHAGPRRCHTSGRIFDMALRAGVAGTRAMGFEMDLRELTAEEEAEARRAVGAFKARRALLHSGRLHRLEADDPAVSAEIHVAEDGAGFLAFALQTEASAQPLARPLRLAGLDPAARYRVRVEGPPPPRNRNKPPLGPLALGEPLDLSGAALMGAGLRLPNSFPATLRTIEGTRL